MATRSPAAFRQELVDIEVVGPEAGLAVGEVEVPHALEGVAAPELPHGAVGGDGLGAVLTGFDVTVTGRCSTSCLAQLHEMPPCLTMIVRIPGARGSHGNPAVPEQLLALRRLRRGADRAPASSR
jgi:hypothetical protein